MAQNVSQQFTNNSLYGVKCCDNTALSASDRAAGFNLGLVQQLFRSENKNSFLFSSTTFANTKKGKSLLRFCRKSCEIMWHPFFVVQNASRKKNRKILPFPFPPLNSRPTPSVARSSSISAARSPNEPSRQTLRLITTSIIFFSSFCKQFSNHLNYSSTIQYRSRNITGLN